MRITLLLPFILIITFLSCLSITANAQTIDTSVHFGSPVDIPIYLSGTFAEPRGNHFHSGMDIRTQGTEGLKIYSVEDGFVSRVKISAYGYGNALYVQHPSGYTSVYAHLSGFNPEIEKYIHNLHYQKEDCELDEGVPYGKLKVKKGELIAYSGNSGGSGGPHLHFEIRNSKTEHPLNPQLFGFTVKDKVAPIIHNVLVYAKDWNVASPISYAARKTTQGYRLMKDTMYFNTDTISFGLHTTDKMENSTSTNGIYSMQVMVDDTVAYSFHMDSISFSSTRYVQCHVDNAEKVDNNNTVYRCHRLPGNDFKFVYDVQKNDGYLGLTDSVFHKIEIVSKDFQGNASTVKFYVSKSKNISAFKLKEFDFDTVFYYNRSNTFYGAGLKAQFPTDAFYTKVFFNYDADSIQLKNMNALGPLHRLHKDTEPVHKNYSLSLFVNEVPKHLQSKGIIVRIDRRGRIKAYTTKHDGAWFTASPREFGNFTLVLDTVPPVIRPQNFTSGGSIAGKRDLRLTATDDLSGIVSYKATIDDKWILLVYDYKNDLFIYTLDERCPAGEHNFEMVVTDDAGNAATYKCTIKN